jgi:hypothetical protein
LGIGHWSLNLKPGTAPQGVRCRVSGVGTDLKVTWWFFN